MKLKEEKHMVTFFETLGGTYRQEGDYLLPNIEIPEIPQLGFWGQRRHKYLLEHQHALYSGSKAANDGRKANHHCALLFYV